MSPSPSHFERLQSALADRTAVIGVIGLGYVGLPLGLVSQEAGYRVLGFDINQARVAAVNAGEHVIGYLSPDTIPGALASGRFAATSDFSRLAEADVLVICVPTPLADERKPDLSYIVATAEAIATTLRPGQLVVLESTTWPGTTREVLAPILVAAGGRVGETLFLAFSPEREDPGNARFSTKSIPKVVGADDDRSRALAVDFYSSVVSAVVPVSGTAAAEAVKLTENIFRAVNIALVNELKTIYGAMGVDVWEVIDAAATKPFGFMPFYPGPGLGGHCIPIDPFYLTWKAREFGVETRFIELAGEINTNMPTLVVERLAQALREGGTDPAGARVLILGAAYKKNVDDIRESPALTLIELVEELGAACDFHDTFVAAIPSTREHANLAGRRSTPIDPTALAAYDAILVCTDHDDIDYAMVAEHARLIVDTRNVFARKGLQGAVIKA